ncbi:MAG: hypothetical protein FMNOHCHN_02694 [Ignavibacteriaceae bacterium]|nr:hypothetical protein [Ignavibacteriaceae bacterium]MCK6615418.1 PEGA domain-containing protein [Ignavibacteriaceae bacterium]
MNFKILLLQSIMAMLLLNSCSDEKPTQPADEHLGSVYIVTRPDSAEIFINNMSTRQFSPATVMVSSGVHTIMAKKNGFRDSAISVQVITGEIITRSFDLHKTAQGAISLSSFPQGAMIYINGSNTGKMTPSVIYNLTPGTENVTLMLSGYKDTSFTVAVTAGQTISRTVVLSELPLMVVQYNNIKLFEKAGLGFSGLKLATGTQVNSNSADADIFYDLTEIKSQHLRTPAPLILNYTAFYNRVTFANIDDTVDAPVKSNTGRSWTYSKAITETNYSFLYTQDHHFVKLKITETGGGTGPSDPDKWVRVSYKYNQTARDRRF